MKTLRQIREDFEIISVTLDEAVKKHPAKSGFPNMPSMLLFKRITYRIYPDNQMVALYYSRMIDKYLTIPFSKEGVLQISEGVMHDTLDEDWSDAKYKNPEGGLTKAGVMRYRRENPGSKLQTAVTTKPSKLKPGSKAANRRKSFCARMGGMKKRLTSAKTARDPDSRINKALRKWNCEESFKDRLQIIREAKYGGTDAALDAASFIPGPVGSAASLASAYRSYKKGDKVGAALDAASALPGVGYLAKGAKVAKVASKARPLERLATKIGGKKGLKAYRGLKKGAADAAASSGSDDNKSSSSQQNIGTTGKINLAPVKTGSSWTDKKKQLQENKITDIRKMIDEDVESKELTINGRTITLNNSMAKRIVEVYDSVNSRNKKIVETMLNEDLESFKKLLNFSIRK